MNHKSFIIAFFCVTIAFHLQGRDRRYGMEEVLSSDSIHSLVGKNGTLRNSYKYSAAGLMVTVHSIGTERQPQDVLIVWNVKDKAYEPVHIMESMSGETFDRPLLFSMQDLRFLNIATEPSGSGGFVTDTILWLAPDGTLHPVEFEQASLVFEAMEASDQVVQSGGENEFFFQDDTMKFEFTIATQGDPHCCPSGGVVSGNYKLIGDQQFDSFTRKYKSDFKIVVDKMQHAAGDFNPGRVAAPSSNSSAH